MAEWFFLLGGLLAGGGLAAVLIHWRDQRLKNSPQKAPGVGITGVMTLGEESLDVLRSRLEVVQKLNRSLVQAQDEQKLLSELLDLMITATKTAGATYIPLDELGEPLAQIHQGQVPLFPSQSWTIQLKTKEVTEVCQTCKNLHKETHAGCPLAGNPFVPEGEITCLPIQRDGRRLGMINLYHQPGQSLDVETISFLQDMLDETSLAIDNLRLHNQEVSTLRQIQMVRRSTDETDGMLTRLLDSMCTAVDCDLAALFLTGRTSGQGTILRSRQPSSPTIAASLQKISARLQPGENITRFYKTETIDFLPGFESVAALPVLSPSGQQSGFLVAARVGPVRFLAREENILTSIAAQAGMALENERKILELEYRAVMEERSRLAREIHDGLAQTLAFLKLQGAQMNGLLQQKDLERLEEMLRTNQKVLSDAYTETRQAINHLRLSPQPGVRSWLTDTVRDFQQASQIKVTTSFQADPENLAVEIQSQLMRIIQEALNNIRKHAHAEHAMVTFREYQGDLVLEIHDNGYGFMPEDIPSLSQYGLRGMRERAEMIGAEFQIISQPGNGTTVRLQLPYAFTQEAPR